MGSTRYHTKKERKAKRKILMTLVMEYEARARSMTGQYVYSGDTYEHTFEELDRIHARIREVYLSDESLRWA